MSGMITTCSGGHSASEYFGSIETPFGVLKAFPSALTITGSISDADAAPVVTSDQSRPAPCSKS